MLLNLPDVPVVAFDTETSGLFPDVTPGSTDSETGARVACVAAAWYEGDDLRSIALPFDQGVRDKYIDPQLGFFDETGDSDPNLGRAEWDELCHWLATRKLLVAHNAQYDLIMMNAGTRHFPGVDLSRRPVYCSLIASGELDPTESKSLDAASRRAGLGGKAGLDAILEWNKANAKRLRSMGCAKPLRRYDLAPWSVAEGYVTVDAENTIGLFRYQVPRLAAQPEVSAWAKRLFKQMQLVTWLEMRGVGYDGESSSAAARKLSAHADSIADSLPTPVTRAGMLAYFCGTLGLHADRQSEKTGAPSIDEEQTRKWASEGVALAAEYAEVSKIRRTVSMHYDGYSKKIGADDRLRTRFRLGHVKSGRLSCERVQMQALPKEDKSVKTVAVPHIKSLIIPRPGNGLYNFDLAQAELRVAAHLAGCQSMLDDIAAGVDLHGRVCQAVMRVDPSHPDWKFKRDIAKRANFGGVVGVGPQTFQDTLSKLADIHMPLDECTRIVYGWRRQFPEFMRLKEALGKVVEKRERDEGVGYIDVLKGTELQRRMYFGPRDYPHTAWSRAMQGATATAFMHVLTEVEDRWPGYMVLTVHDSILFEMPTEIGGLEKGDEFDDASPGIVGDICRFVGQRMTDLLGTPMKLEGERTK